MNGLCSPHPVPVPFTISLKIEMGQDGRWEGTGTGTDERSAGRNSGGSPIKRVSREARSPGGLIPQGRILWD